MWAILGQIFELSAYFNEVPPIAALDNSNISSFTDEPPEFLNKAFSCHTICCL